MPPALSAGNWGLILVTYWLCYHGLRFLHPKMKVLDSYTLEKLTNPFLPSAASSALHDLWSFLPVFLTPLLSTLFSFFSTLAALAFPWAPPALTHLLKLQNSIEVISVWFLCTVKEGDSMFKDSELNLGIYVNLQYLHLIIQFSWECFKQK